MTKRDRIEAEVPYCDVLGDPLGLARRPEPRSEQWYRAEAERELGDLYRDMPGVRELRIREIITMLRMPDRAYCANARVR